VHLISSNVSEVIPSTTNPARRPDMLRSETSDARPVLRGPGDAFRETSDKRLKVHCDSCTSTAAGESVAPASVVDETRVACAACRAASASTASAAMASEEEPPIEAIDAIDCTLFGPDISRAPRRPKQRREEAVACSVEAPAARFQASSAAASERASGRDPPETTEVFMHSGVGVLASLASRAPVEPAASVTRPLATACTSGLCKNAPDCTKSAAALSAASAAGVGEVPVAETTESSGENRADVLDCRRGGSSSAAAVAGAGG